jgi:hypothetical protein
MAKRVKAKMAAYAKHLRAMKNGRPDWYLVAEHLAEIAIPELVSQEEPSGRGPGRPKGEYAFLAWEVDRIMREKGCGVFKACCELASPEGGPQRVRLWGGSDGPNWLMTRGSPWTGENPRTLERRYHEWKNGWEEEQKRHQITVTFEE